MMFYINIWCASIEFNYILVLAGFYDIYLTKIDIIEITSLQLHNLLKKCQGLESNCSIVILIKTTALCTLF